MRKLFATVIIAIAAWSGSSFASEVDDVYERCAKTGVLETGETWTTAEVDIVVADRTVPISCKGLPSDDTATKEVEQSNETCGSESTPMASVIIDERPFPIVNVAWSTAETSIFVADRSFSIDCEDLPPGDTTTEFVGKIAGEEDVAKVYDICTTDESVSMTNIIIYGRPLPVSCDTIRGFAKGIQ